MTTAIILDCETTDKDPKTCEVVELAWKDYVLGGPLADRSHCARFSHKLPMRWGALAAHHILPEELVHYAPLMPLGELPPADFWIGHNVNFDWQCLGSPQVRRICTLAMARAVWPECDSHTLSALTYFTQGATPATREKLRSAHSAAADIDLCEELLNFILKAHPEIKSLEDLYAFSEESCIPKIMTFGKFKDHPVSHVDRGYANWYRRQPEPDPYLLEAFRRTGLL